MVQPRKSEDPQRRENRALLRSVRNVETRAFLQKSQGMVLAVSIVQRGRAAP